MQRTGFATQTPPALFPSIFGGLGLGLAWHRAVDVFGISRGVGDMLFGMAVALFAFSLFAYVVKVARRPGVLMDEMPVLPGRAGMTALILCFYLTSAGLVPIAPRIAILLLSVGLVGHFGFLVLFAIWWRGAPAEARGLNPSWHLHFVGFILADLSLIPLGFQGLALIIFWITLPIAVAIWALSAWQLTRNVPPAPLRPMLAIHLAPVSLMGTNALLLGYLPLALVFVGFGWLVLVGLLICTRWITTAGFSPLWGAFTFPLAAFASLNLLLAAALQSGGLRVAGGVLLVAATLVVVPILAKVMQAWAKGGLGVKTNAARV
ncbi:hypothetical protein ACMU_11925 [Actibacterium mucosum KCTC 23349]|uniref:Tellurium resistance protein n=1 Tax=Actibacterium mucosum KCTC 23349 TaxID=1454373 RepID=A0A037ZIQ3_9RHOB|nr:hypothetical protein [Actibacterium mucosum]KAJ55397.1 hypothetical protein ACMU_11925 [Actibacterium mucosum KCTC 23349]